MQYRIYKTTMGRKYRMRMCEDEVAERWLFRVAVVVLPLFFSMLMTAIWLKGG